MNLLFSKSMTVVLVLAVWDPTSKAFGGLWLLTPTSPPEGGQHTGGRTHVPPQGWAKVKARPSGRLHLEYGLFTAQTLHLGQLRLERRGTRGTNTAPGTKPLYHSRSRKGNGPLLWHSSASRPIHGPQEEEMCCCSQNRVCCGQDISPETPGKSNFWPMTQ